MLYTPLTMRAMRICYDAHHGQYDKSDVPYVFHPYHLAEQMDTEEAVCTALLHDVLEDTELTSTDLLGLGIPSDVVEALEALCHNTNVPYLSYVRALKQNPLARVVKIADLKHNSDLTRLEGVTAADRRRVEKYAKALAILEA